eukprot:Awhi_evm1s9082
MKFGQGLIGLATIVQCRGIVKGHAERFLRSAGDLADELNKGHQHRHIREKRDGEEENILGYMVNFEDMSSGEEDFMEDFGEFVVQNYKEHDLSFMYLEIPESVSEDAIIEIRSKSYVESVEHELQYHSKALYWNKGRVGSVTNTGNYVGNTDFEGNGYGTHIYIIDSGIDDHPEFGNRIDRSLSRGFGRSDSYDCLGH